MYRDKIVCGEILEYFSPSKHPNSMHCVSNIIIGDRMHTVRNA